MDEYCRCECHTDVTVMHIMPCCELCEFCGMGVTNMFVHQRKCNATTQVTQGYKKKFSFKEQK